MDTPDPFLNPSSRRVLRFGDQHDDSSTSPTAMALASCLLGAVLFLTGAPMVGTVIVPFAVGIAVGAANSTRR